MIAIDTNLVIRYLTNDDQEQSRRARELINDAVVFMPITVVLEVDWVLRSSYGLSPEARVQAIHGFAGLPTVMVEDAVIVGDALDLTAKGMDFADALHVTRSAHCKAFATFDRKLIKEVQAAGYSGIEA